MITVDDVMEVAREEFEEDVLLLGGVGSNWLMTRLFNHRRSVLPGYWLIWAQR